MPVKNNTFGVAQQTPFALHKRNNANSIYYSFFCPETKEPKILCSKGEMTRHQSHQKPSCQRVCVTSLLCRGGLPLTMRVIVYRIQTLIIAKLYQA